MYAAIRQGKAKTGTAEELARRIKEGAIPIISDVPGFQAYYVIYAPDDTVTAISIFDDYAGAQESNRRGLAWIEQNLSPLLTGTATAVAGPVIVHTLAWCNASEAAEAGRRDPLYNGMVDHGKMGRGPMMTCRR